MPHRFFRPGIAQDGIFPLALHRSTAQGHEHRFFFFCKVDLIGCHGLLLRCTSYLLHVPCLFDLLHLCSCRRGNLPDDGFPRLAVARQFGCILGHQRAIHHVGQCFHDRIIGRKLVRRFEIPDGQLAVRQHFDNVYDHGRIDILANRPRRLQRLKETGRVHPGIHLGEEVVSLAEVVADHAPCHGAAWRRSRDDGSRRERSPGRTHRSSHRAGPPRSAPTRSGHIAYIHGRGALRKVPLFP